MRLNLTWPGNPNGDRYPIPAARPVTVTVTVIDETTGKSTKEPYSITVSLDNDSLTAERVNGDSAEYLVAASNASSSFPELAVTASPAAGGQPLSMRVRVVGSALQNTAAAARFIVALSLMYVCILIPNIQGALKFLSEIPSLPALGAGALLLGWLRRWVTRMAHHPIVMTTMALVAMVAIALLFSRRQLVINQSLDSIELPEGGLLEPGGYVIGSMSKALLGSARCALTDERDRIPLPVDPTRNFDQTKLEAEPKRADCVRFGSPPNVGLLLASSLLLRRVNIGCIDLHPSSLPGTPLQPWRKEQSCQPRGLLLEGQSPGDAIVNYDAQKGRVDRVTTQLVWQPEPAELRWERADNLLAIALTPWPVPAKTNDKSNNLLGLVFRRAEPSLTLETTVDLSKDEQPPLLTTLPKTAGGILDADVRVGQTVTGKFSARLAANSLPQCWASRTGERLLKIFFRDNSGQSYSAFRADLPEAVSNVPVCWTGANRPSFAEIHLDPNWSASAGWALELPGQLSPERLTILDQGGHAWGELKCPPAPKNSALTIGPIALDQVRPELTTLFASDHQDPRSRHPENGMTWSADPSHATDHWAWACWINDQPPAVLNGANLWHTALDPTRPGRAYKLGHGLRICCMDSNRAPHAGRCETAPNAESIAWYQAQGPADCDPKLSRLAP